MRHGDKSQVRDIHNKAERTTTDHDLPLGPSPIAVPQGHSMAPMVHGGRLMVCPGFSCGLGPRAPPPASPHLVSRTPAPSTRPDGRWHPRFLPSSSSVGAFVLATLSRGSQLDTTTTTTTTPPLSQDSPDDTLRPYHHPRRVHSPSPLTLTTHSPDCVCTLLRPVWLSAVCPPRCPDGPAFLRKISKPACLDCPPLTRCVDHGPIAWEGIYFIFPLGFISLGAIRSLPNLSPPIGASPGCLPSPIGLCRLRPDLNFGKMDSILEEEEARGEPRRVASRPELQTLDAPPGQTSFFLAVMPAGHCPI